MTRLALCLVLSWFLAAPAAACVGKTVVVGAVETPRGQVVAQLIAILINERTGTTVKIAGFPDGEALHRGLAAGDVDIAVEHAQRALGRLGLEAPADPAASLEAAKATYLERLNLIWMPPLGFSGPATDPGPGAPVVRKDTVKKFPALPRLIAKTEGLLPESVLAALAKAGEPAQVAREFLREKKLI